jgi:proteasome lid subunit RPN8/RPN11
MINETNLEILKGHAALEYPRECCGLLIVSKGKQKYIQCTNLSKTSEHFIISPEDYAKAEDTGEVLAIVHSHPNASPNPSQADLVSCEKTGLPWIIISWPSGTTHTFYPNGYKPPLMGRTFVYGVLDCYTIVRDYYKEVLNIDLKDPDRGEDGWWNKGQNLYLDNAESFGFVRVFEDPKPHDVILMAVASPVPSHAAVYLGDNIILHHQEGRLSTKDVYTGWYRKVTTHVFRHKDLLK